MDLVKAHDPIPETVAEALALWDSGESVFSVEMGGLGPGYEMAIQGLAFEIMRALHGFDWLDTETLSARFDAVVDPIVHELNSKPWGGFSGAQVGAASSLAAMVCKRGYRAALRDPALDDDRRIQVSKKDLRSA